MKLRTGVKLWVEPLCDRIVPSTTPTYIEPGPVALQDPSQTTNTSPPSLSSPTSGQQYIGIDAINPLPGINLAPPPVMPIDPTKEAAILNLLNAKIGNLQGQIAGLNPNDPNYTTQLASLQGRIANMQAAVLATQGIAANVLTYNQLLPQLNALAAQIQPYITNPPTTVEGSANLAMLLAQYNTVHSQLTQLVNSTMTLFFIRRDLMSTEGLSDGYGS